MTYPQPDTNYTSKGSFLNGTDMPDDEAQKLVNQFTERVNQSEMELSESLRIGERMMDIFKNKIWQPEDMAFFEAFDATPIEFSVARPLINNMISKQRRQKFEHSFVPLDVHSETRKLEQIQEFVDDSAEDFSSREEAMDFYQKYADDSYAQMITSLLKKFKDIDGTKWKESECFEGAVITGADFLKVDLDHYGRPQPKRRNLSRMVWDTNSIEYDLSDAEFVGDKVRWYKNDMIMNFPELKERLENHFEHYTNLKARNRFEPQKRWKDWWKFDQSDGLQVKLVDLCYRDIEERFLIIDNETGDEQFAEPDMTEDEVMDMLGIKIFQDMQHLPPEQQEEMLMGEDSKENILAEVEKRFTIDIEYRPCWYQMVFSFNTLLLHQKVPYPFEGHPYMPYFPQFNDGYFTGFLEDIEDIIIALNKALAIRELMMAHSAKGMVIVDEKVLDDSGVTKEDVADEYTRIGGMLVLKLKFHKSVQDAISQINTVGEGIPAINNIIADYDERLFRVSGVNLAQLGVTQSETPASRYKMQLAEGETTNGLIFDNFVRTLEEFYKQKMIPVCVEYAKNHPHSVKRLIGEKLGQWSKINFDKTFPLFESGIRSGEYSFTLKPSKNDTQAGTEFNSQMMELAMAGAVPLEVSLEFSNHPNKHDIIRRLRQFKREAQKTQLQNSVDIQRLQQIIMSDPDVSVEMADRLIKKARLENQAEQQKQQQQPAPQGQQPAPQGAQAPQSQMVGGMKTKQGASQSKKEQNIEAQVMQQALRTSQ